MNAKQALKEARRRWGDKAAVRDEPRFASTDEKRAEARAQRSALMQSLTKEEQRARYKELDALLYDSYRYRYTVGRIALGLFFAVEGQGDSWEAAFAQCDERNKKYAKVG
jgi:hypothetical protein